MLPHLVNLKKCTNTEMLKEKQIYKMQLWPIWPVELHLNNLRNAENLQKYSTTAVLSCYTTVLQKSVKEGYIKLQRWVSFRKGTSSNPPDPPQ